MWKMKKQAKTSSRLKTLMTVGACAIKVIDGPTGAVIMIGMAVYDIMKNRKNVDKVARDGASIVEKVLTNL